MTLFWSTMHSNWQRRRIFEHAVRRLPFGVDDLLTRRHRGANGFDDNAGRCSLVVSHFTGLQTRPPIGFPRLVVPLLFAAGAN